MARYITATPQEGVGQFILLLDVDPDTVGQYIGFNDYQNNEVYDGDVLQGEGCYPLVVKIEQGHVNAYWKDNEGRIQRDLLYACEIQDYELVCVGNIHDNPKYDKGW